MNIKLGYFVFNLLCPHMGPSPVLHTTQTISGLLHSIFKTRLLKLEKLSNKNSTSIKLSSYKDFYSLQEFLFILDRFVVFWFVCLGFFGGFFVYDIVMTSNSLLLTKYGLRQFLK